jgi:transposase-like protein
MILSCPRCDSKAFKRNGYTRHGKQNHRCLDCGRQFSLEPMELESSHNQREFVGTIQIEGISVKAVF